jgi:hypothetical protein
MSPDQFSSVSAAWVDAWATLLIHLCSQLLLVGAAAYGVYKAFRRDLAEANSERIGALETVSKEHTDQLSSLPGGTVTTTEIPVDSQVGKVQLVSVPNHPTQEKTP